ncbi:hypothetical protein MYXO_03140 [Myxococcaceae bacterium]|nr:hypothetical protein MYXO_03140 [Myxococcaceae bacterium]
MGLAAGRRVWVECEVKPGPFSNERLVRIVGPSGEWFGFVGEFLLREQIERGSTAVQGIVDEVTNGRVSLFLPGASITGGVFEQDSARVTPFGSLQA